MSPSHEHDCPICGGFFRCYESHQNFCEKMVCDFCASLDVAISGHVRKDEV
jgi:hypothetical protein